VHYGFDPSCEEGIFISLQSKEIKIIENFEFLINVLMNEFKIKTFKIESKLKITCITSYYGNYKK